MNISGCNCTSGFVKNPWDDATWILTSAFIIFTMQSGFGLLESGTAARKNEVNIMVKNAVDVIFGGLSYWLLGYGFSFGNGPGSNAFCGVGHFALDADDMLVGDVFSHFLFQASFATTATTIVSGAMAERCRLEAYIVFSFFNTFIFCFPAHWIWAENGWLKAFQVVDIAGDGPVHLVGGVTSLVAAIMLKPRDGRFTGSKEPPPMGSPTNALLGMFMLWWGWLGFNCGSTFGISGGKWKLAARAAVSTIMSSIAGGITGITISYATKGRRVNIMFLINGILGGLVSITAICALSRPWESVVIGSAGAAIACFGEKVLAHYHIDDPVNAVSIHAFSSIWGLIAVGIFGRKDNIEFRFSKRNGILQGGGLYLMGVQLLAILTLITWTLFTSYAFLRILDKVVGLRCTPEEEELGADIVHHGIGGEYNNPRWIKCVSKKQKRNDVRDSTDVPKYAHGVFTESTDLSVAKEPTKLHQLTNDSTFTTGVIFNPVLFHNNGRVSDIMEKKKFPMLHFKNRTTPKLSNVDRIIRYTRQALSEKPTGETLNVTGAKWAEKCQHKFVVRKNLRSSSVARVSPYHIAQNCTNAPRVLVESTTTQPPVDNKHKQRAKSI